MLSERDFARIVREMDGLRGVDAVAYLREKSPWFLLIEPAISRAAGLLEGSGIFYVLRGLRPLPLYGVPYPSRDLVFAVRVDDVRRFEEGLRGNYLHPLSRLPDRSEFLDAQNNRRITFEYSPRPFKWDEEVVRRSVIRMGVRILSAEDYAAALLSRRDSVMMMELAAKVIYANMDVMDLEYLKSRASQAGAGDLIEAILEGLRRASSR